MSRPLLKTYLKGALGLILGAAFSFLAIRQTNFAEVKGVIEGISPRWLLVGLGCYVLDLGLRTLRWGILVRRVLSVGYAVVGEVLLVGYAVNNILPARLGELFRADYMSRQTDASRSAVLGTIVIERLLDASMVVLGLGIGLLALNVGGGRTAAGLRHPVLILGIGASMLAAAGIALAALGRLRRAPAGRRHWLALAAGNFATGLRSLDASNLAISIVLSIGIWIAEGAAIWCMVRSIGAVLSPGDTMVLLSIASLSTLLPTAPGYVGSYQLAFAISFSLFGAAQAQGVAAATVTQAVLFGSVTVAGLSAYMGRAAQRMFARQHG
ncbi:MAG TPA: lysylphosphatidylglycerol synthase transmembrane domain-containing protein [Stellaceae bacterium]|jgi:uncharacterized membrane protein YbhN (UPF0104 family)|nr:lysylphosphatidylglycerol synthase transmembrane domain-containing protein [Stellaceae bacterium]